MKALFVIPALLLLATPSAAFDPQSHAWTLLEMQDMPSRTIPEGYREIENPYGPRSYRLRTAYDAASDKIVGVSFSGCSGLGNEDYPLYQNNWKKVVVQPACVTMIVTKDHAPTDPRYNVREQVDTQAEAVEARFLDLASLIHETKVDWQNKTLTYSDVSGQTLMRFRLVEPVR